MQGLVDLDCWKKDRLKHGSLLDWLEALVEGGSLPVAEFLNAVDLDLLVLLLKRFIRVYRTDDPDEPPEIEKSPEVFELDEHYPIVFHRWDARAPLIRDLLEELYERDYSYFVTVMEDIWWGVESQLEEASFQVRNARLQDRGFPDLFEALEIYRPLAEASCRREWRSSGKTRETTRMTCRWRSRCFIPEPERSFLSEVLDRVLTEHGGDEIRREMAFLTNRVMVAEGVDFSDRDAVRAAVKLAHDTVNLGLEHVSRGDRRQAVEVIRRRYLQHLFRVGWGLLHSLRRRAKRAEETLGLPSSLSEVEFLDTPYREALAGFLRPKPRYFEAIDARSGTGYRAFASLRDVDRAGEVVEDVGALPDLVVRFLGQSLPELATLRPSSADDFRLSAVLLTGFANSVLGRGPSLPASRCR